VNPENLRVVMFPKYNVEADSDDGELKELEGKGIIQVDGYGGHA